MSKYRNRLPQLKDQIFMADGGLETTLIYQENIDLPLFAAFDLLKDAAGTAVLQRYFTRYAEMGREQNIGVVLETPTWRASADWGSALGYDAMALADANRKAVSLLLRIRAELETTGTEIVISGNIGPRGDGYRPGTMMTAAQAQQYHAPQIETFAQTDADMVAAFTMNYTEEAIGIVAAAQRSAMPVAISFTVETDGRLPTGESLQHAISRTDEASGGYPAYYMINCAHPTHFENVLHGDGDWLHRIRGLRANASKRSHAELDASTDLDAGDADELGQMYGALHASLPKLSVVGGCCGTDHRHVESMCRAMKHVQRNSPREQFGDVIANR